jgi:cytochrome c oxidase cbb3-type subunit 2
MVDPAGIGPRMSALRMVGVPYTDAEIAAGADAVKGKTEMEAVIAYLQGLGRPAPDAKTANAMGYAEGAKP